MNKLTEFASQSEFGLMGHEKSRYAKMSKNIWIADSGALVHTTSSMDELVKTIECNSLVLVVNGKTLESKKIGRKIGSVQMKKGKFKKITPYGVKYVSISQNCFPTY